MTGSLHTLTLLEEFLLLALDDQTGRFHALAPSTLDCATAGALLMDLTLRNRIDNDLRDMFVTDSSPTGDALLDPVLNLMALAPILTPHPITYWLRHLADEAPAYQERALRRLQERGIIKRENHKILWMFGTRRYPTMNDREVREVKQRLVGIVSSNEIPTAHDVMLTGLAEACDLFRFILAPAEAEKAKKRIHQISHLDLVGQAVAKGVADIGQSVAMASGFR